MLLVQIFVGGAVHAAVGAGVLGGLGIAGGVIGGTRFRQAYEEHTLADEARQAQEHRDAQLAAEAERQRQIAALDLSLRLAHEAAFRLPRLLVDAGQSLDEAKEHLAKPRFSPFWEAIERATGALCAFDDVLREIADHRTRYRANAATMQGDVPSFSLDPQVLPDAAPVHQRVEALYMRAQESSEFSNCYEQRRTTTTIDKTNAILMAGFSTLDSAIHALGDRIERSLNTLGDTVTERIGSLETSLASVATVAAAQRGALLSEIRRAGDAGDEILGQLRADAERMGKHEAASRRMLDNLQRKQPPGVFDPR